MGADMALMELYDPYEPYIFADAVSVMEVGGWRAGRDLDGRQVVSPERWRI